MLHARLRASVAVVLALALASTLGACSSNFRASPPNVTAPHTPMNDNPGTLGRIGGDDSAAMDNEYF